MNCLRNKQKPTYPARFLLGLATLAFAISVLPTPLNADEVSFLVDPATIDSNNDGFITGNEFQPVGTDGTIFGLTPVNNLVGMPRFLLSDTNGLHYGGGGGSTLAFDFTVSHDINLESYTLSSTGFFLGNPDFTILDGVTALSSNNTSNNSGDTHNFNSGPISLTAGTVYSFQTETFGAGIQAFMGSWTYSRTAIPEPTTWGVLAFLSTSVIVRRRR